MHFLFVGVFILSVLIWRVKSKDYAVLIKPSSSSRIETVSIDLGCNNRDQITDNLFILECPFPLRNNQLEELKYNSGIEIEALSTYILSVETGDYELQPRLARLSTDKQPQQTRIDQKMSVFKRMGIPQAWSRGYTGKGVVVAVVDIGVNTDNPDLKPNIDIERQWNAVKDTRDVTPVRYHSYWDNKLPDHGNNCAGLIAAANGSCGPGVAYGARLLPITAVSSSDHGFGLLLSFTTQYIAKSLSYGNDYVGVYSTSLGPKSPFTTVDLATKTVLEQKTKSGRNGKGSIYVFPAGPVADGYADDRHTITVNGIGVDKDFASFTQRFSSSVITSVYGEDMTTTSCPGFRRKCKCTGGFRGTSAAVAVVAAIAALALEANEQLTWRDMQHLVVRSSSPEGLKEYNKFKTNGAGLRYHFGLGFGRLNAEKMVQLASDWVQVSPEASIVRHSAPCNQAPPEKHCRMQFEVRCNGWCVEKIEHVSLTLLYETSDERNMEIQLYSPDRTRTFLMAKEQSQKKTTARSSVTFISVHFWDESPTGTWELYLTSLKHGSIRSTEASLTIYGSSNNVQPPTLPNTPTPTLSTETSSQHRSKTGLSVISYALKTLFTYLFCMVLHVLARHTYT